MNSLQNAKSIGGGYIEATCKDCGEVFVFSKGDSIGVRLDESLTAWPLCSQCAKKSLAAGGLDDGCGH